VRGEGTTSEYIEREKYYVSSCDRGWYIGEAGARSDVRTLTEEEDVGLTIIPSKNANSPNHGV
jgi:hypothetical protein